jgi:heme exporter protein D
MNWGSWHDFLAMGGYALYVWGSYAVTAGLIALEVIMLLVRRHNAMRSAGSPEGGFRP